MQALAAIFDLDGTIIESESAWGKAYFNVLLSLGAKPETKRPETFGISVKDNWRNLLLKYNVSTTKTLDELEVLTYLEYEKFIPEIYVREGAIELITNLKDAGVEIGLATLSSWKITDTILRRLNIESLFDNITTGEEVVNQKPDPEIFIKAAEKMNLEPEACLAFEDSGAGAKAAKDAGMKVIAIDPTGENPELTDADLVVGEFSEVTPKAIDLIK